MNSELWFIWLGAVIVGAAFLRLLWKTFRVAFIAGMLFGGGICGIGAAAITLHLVTSHVESQTASLGEAQQHVTEQYQQNLSMAEQVIATWQKRAQLCEAKFSTVTVVYEKQDIASVPVLHGMLAIGLSASQDGARPAMAIPAKVEIYTSRPDVRYEWRDARTGESQGGLQLPHSPSETQ